MTEWLRISKKTQYQKISLKSRRNFRLIIHYVDYLLIQTLGSLAREAAMSASVGIESLMVPSLKLL